jgi:hypothetical protein
VENPAFNSDQVSTQQIKPNENNYQQHDNDPHEDCFCHCPPRPLWLLTVVEKIAKLKAYAQPGEGY